MLMGAYFSLYLVVLLGISLVPQISLLLSFSQTERTENIQYGTKITHFELGVCTWILNIPDAKPTFFSFCQNFCYQQLCHNWHTHCTVLLSVRLLFLAQWYNLLAYPGAAIALIEMNWDWEMVSGSRCQYMWMQVNQVSCRYSITYSQCPTKTFIPGSSTPASSFRLFQSIFLNWKSFENLHSCVSC